MVVRKWRRCAGRNSDLVGFPRPALLGSQDDSAGDFASAQQIQRLVGFSKRQLNHMVEYLPGGSHAEYVPHLLPSANRRRMNQDISCYHANRSQTSVISEQT